MERSPIDTIKYPRRRDAKIILRSHTSSRTNEEVRWYLEVDHLIYLLTYHILMITGLHKHTLAAASLALWTRRLNVISWGGGQKSDIQIGVSKTDWLLELASTFFKGHPRRRESGSFADRNIMLFRKDP